jgi:hypothetical protein
VTLTLKTGACFAALADDGMARASLARVAGLFLHDTRHLADYAWDLGDLALVHQEWDGAGVTQFWSRFSHHAQHLLLERRFDLRPDGFEDRLTFRGEATDPQEVQLSLSADADFVDSFELRGRVRGIGRNPVAREPRSDGLRFAYVAQDGVVSTTDLTWDGFPPGGVLTVAKGDEATVRLRGRFASTLATSPVEPPRIDWSPTIRARAAEAPELARALSDIEALALSTEHGLVIAAGRRNQAVMSPSRPRSRKARYASLPSIRVGHMTLAGTRRPARSRTNSALGNSPGWATCPSAATTGPPMRRRCS